MAYRVPIASREKIEIPKQKSWSKKDREIVWNSTEPPGTCYYCEKQIKPIETWHMTHTHGKTRSIAGSNDLKDIAPAHAACNMKEWYENECPCLAKAKRLAGETGQNKKKKKINSPGFRGHRKFNGDIVWRD